MKLMIVYDSSIKYLAGAGIEIVGISGAGKQAVELFKQTLPDVVSLDSPMPEMYGLQCLAALLKIKPDVKVMVVFAL